MAYKRHPDLTSEEKKEVKKLYLSGLGINRVALALRLRNHQVEKHIKEEGLTRSRSESLRLSAAKKGCRHGSKL